TILVHLRAPRLAMWCTWPLLGEWAATVRAPSPWPWGMETTGGAWVKSGPGDTGHYGPGYHWSGCSEMVLIYTRGGGHCDRAAPLRNAWIEPPAQHSRKPVEWQAQMIRRWCPPGGLVLDPFAGLGSVAEAVLVAGEGRRYLGTEIDPERHAGAMALIAQRRVG
ncbi:MAG: site-specific DNA-methyltransferase, partial [Actinomycetes bacterium]|nr:site-specific DNA-methyltransferase [Actinomycetes bacterium]MDX5450563.1 site-specific DNA-methyltransferase [Actinomycetes bacterium]